MTLSLDQFTIYPSIEENKMYKVKLNNIKVTNNDNGGYFTFEFTVLENNAPKTMNIFPTRMQWSLDQIAKQLKIDRNIHPTELYTREFDLYFGDQSYVDVKSGLLVPQPVGWSIYAPRTPQAPKSLNPLSNNNNSKTKLTGKKLK